MFFICFSALSSSAAPLSSSFFAESSCALPEASSFSASAKPRSASALPCSYCFFDRLGYASTRREARQLVNHGHYTVNGKRVNIPSYTVNVGDVIAVCENSCSTTRFKKMKEDDAFVAAPKWLERDKNTLSGKVIALPARDDIDFEIAENLIVELYSK